MPQLLLLPAIVSLLLPGCLDLSAPALNVREGNALTVRGVEVTDELGHRWPVEAIPRRPTIRVEWSQPLADPSVVWLLEGSIGDGLAGDLASPPMRADTMDRIIAAQLVTDGGFNLVRPISALEPGADLIVAAAGWAEDTAGRRLGVPFLWPLSVSRASSAGAAVVAAWPADGSAAVAPNLEHFALQLDGELGTLGNATLRMSGRDLALIFERQECATLGHRGGWCVSAPGQALPQATELQLEIDASWTDRTGASIGPWTLSFRTATEVDDMPPSFLPVPCALDEEALDVGCLLVSDDAATVRIQASEPVRAFWASDASVDNTVAPRGDASLTLVGLASDVQLDSMLTLIDAAGRSLSATVLLRTSGPLANVEITEVRADPIGQEPRQEYVEVVNGGELAVDLAGFSITDDPFVVGDVVERTAMLPPLARALLVADAFDPDDVLDDPVPAGVNLLRIGTSIGAGGLSNSGEPLFLRDAEGRRLSEFSAEPRPRRGVCVVRVAPTHPDGPASFQYDAQGGCTPGARDRIPLSR